MFVMFDACWINLYLFVVKGIKHQNQNQFASIITGLHNIIENILLLEVEVFENIINFVIASTTKIFMNKLKVKSICGCDMLKSLLLFKTVIEKP